MGPTVSVGKSVNWVGQCTKHELFFPKYTLFFLFCSFVLPHFLNFFPLSDLKYNLPQISGKIGFFSRKYRIFTIFRRKIDDFSRFFPNFFSSDFFSVKIVSMLPENRFFADKSAEKSDFLFIGNWYYREIHR